MFPSGVLRLAAALAVNFKGRRSKGAACSFYVLGLAWAPLRALLRRPAEGIGPGIERWLGVDWA